MLLFVATGFGLSNVNKTKSLSMTNPPTVTVDPDLCVGCALCIIYDPLHNLDFDSNGKAAFFGISGSAYILADDFELGVYTVLANICPTGAIVFK